MTSSRRVPLPATLQHFPFNLIRHVLPDESLVPTEGQRRTWKEACQQTDVLADNLVKAFKASGPWGAISSTRRSNKALKASRLPCQNWSLTFTTSTTRRTGSTGARSGLRRRP